MYFSFISALLLAILIISPAEASNVFLAQLGSYQTEKESDLAWNEIKSTMKQEFSALSYQLSALSLPPAGKKIYRLQSGPFTLRNEANSFCDKLRANGQDCFVVESAVFSPKSSPVPLVKTAKVEEKTPLPEPEVLSPVIDNAMPTSLPEIRKDMMVVASAAAIPKPSISAPAPKPALPSLGALESPSFSLSDAPKKKSVGNEFAASLAEPSAPSTDQKRMVPQIKPTIAEPKAAVLPSLVQKTPQITAAPAKTDTRLPWLTNNKDVVVARADVFDASASEMTTPLPNVLPPKITPSAPMAETLPELKAETAIAPETVEMAQAAPSAPSANAIPFAIVDRKTGKVVAAPNAKRAPLLPPPSAISDNAASVAGGFVEGRAPKTLDMQIPAGQRRVSASDMISPTDRRVEIDEAIQVPLSNAPKQQANTSEAESQSSATATQEPELSGKRAIAWGATPSRSLLQHSYWVQLSYFNSEQAALNYWQGVKGKLTKTSNGMRVRITRPLQASKSTKRVSLQVGPFIEEADVTALCSVVNAEGITCQMAKDIGVSTVANAKRVRNAPRDYLSRRDVVMLRPSAAGPQYWLQLGSYRSQYDAEIAWLELRDTQPALQPYQPSIAEPSLTSSAEQIYRLRTGPFQIRTEAENICGQLENVEIGCVIVSE